MDFLDSIWCHFLLSMNWGKRASLCAPRSSKCAKQLASLNISRQLPNEMLVSPESRFAYKTVCSSEANKGISSPEETLRLPKQMFRYWKFPSKIYIRFIYRISVKTRQSSQNKVVSRKIFSLTFKITCFSSFFSTFWIPRYSSSFAFWNDSLEVNQNHEDDVKRKKCQLSSFQLFLSPFFITSRPLPCSLSWQRWTDFCPLLRKVLF